MSLKEEKAIECILLHLSTNKTYKTQKIYRWLFVEIFFYYYLIINKFFWNEFIVKKNVNFQKIYRAFLW